MDLSLAGEGGGVLQNPENPPGYILAVGGFRDILPRKIFDVDRILLDRTLYSNCGWVVTHKNQASSSLLTRFSSSKWTATGSKVTQFWKKNTVGGSS